MFHIRIGERDFSGFRPLPAGELRVARLRWEAQGGPQLAQVEVRAAPQELWALFDRLRCPLEVSDDRGRAVWWGYVARVEVHTGAARAAADLQGMCNRVAAAYWRATPGSPAVGPAAQTAWADDAASQAAYGVKERLLRLGAATDEAALAARDALLARECWPVAHIDPLPGGAGGALLTARGWLETLGWRTYAHPAGQEANLAGGPGTQAFGRSGGPAAIAESFTPAEGWTAARAVLRLRRFGAPADALQVMLRADEYGRPGAALAAASLPASALGSGYALFRLDLTPQVALTAGTPYWLAISRSGAAEAACYYAADVDEGCGYARGSLRLGDGASWSPRAPDADLVFAVQGLGQPARQIEAICAREAAGQFLSGIDVEASLPALTPVYRSGERSGLAELLDLLAGGGALAQVSRERHLRVLAAPEPSARDARLLADGRLVDAWGGEIPPWLCPAGAWLRLDEAFPGAIGARQVTDASRAWIAAVDYDALAGRLHLESGAAD